MPRRMTAVGVALVLCLTGCGGGTDGAAGPPSSVSGAAAPTTTPGPTGTPAPTTATPTSAGPSAKPAPAGPDECRVAELTLDLVDGDAAAGTVHRELRFTNSGDRTCVIQGFPGVSYVAGEDGHQVGPAAYREGAKGPAISLAPGDTAAAAVGFVQVHNYDPAVCRPTEVRGLRVYPPHEYDSMFVPAPGTGCAGTPPGNQLTVGTVRR